MYRSYIILFLKLHLKKYLFCDIVILDKKFKKGKKKRKITYLQTFIIYLYICLSDTQIFRYWVKERHTYRF